MSATRPSEGLRFGSTHARTGDRSDARTPDVTDENVPLRCPRRDVHARAGRLTATPVGASALSPCAHWGMRSIAFGARQPHQMRVPRPPPRHLRVRRATYAPDVGMPKLSCAYARTRGSRSSRVARRNDAQRRALLRDDIQYALGSSADGSRHGQPVVRSSDRRNAH